MATSLPQLSGYALLDETKPPALHSSAWILHSVRDDAPGCTDVSWLAAVFAKAASLAQTPARDGSPAAAMDRSQPPRSESAHA